MQGLYHLGNFDDLYRCYHLILAMIVEPNKKYPQKTKKRKKKFRSNYIRLKPISEDYTELNIYHLFRSIDVEPASIAFISWQKEAFITVQSSEIAAKCCQKLNGILLFDEIIKCEMVKPDTDNKTDWFRMSYLSKSTDEQAILTHIQKHGQIENRPKEICLYHHKNDNFSGYAMIRSDSIEDAKKCVSNLQDTELDGNRICCNLTKRNKELTKRYPEWAGKTQWIRLLNIHYNVSKDSIKRLCELRGGTVNKIIRQKDAYGYPTGIVSVKMSNINEAKQVFGILDKEILYKLVVRTAWCDPETINKDFQRKDKIKHGLSLHKKRQKEWVDPTKDLSYKNHIE